MPGKFNAPKTPKIVSHRHVTAAWAHRCTHCARKIMPGDHFRRLDIVTAAGAEKTAKACSDRCAASLVPGTAA